GELLLVELRLRQRPVELLAIESVLPRRMPAELGGAEDAPGNAVAGAVEAAERTLEPLDVRQKRVFAHLDIVHHDLAGHRSAEGELASDLRCRETFHALVEHETPDLAAVRLGLRPDDEDIG